MNVPSLLIAGTTSGVGKTTVSLAIMYGLKTRMGYSIQPFKVGPDFIDPSYHKMVTDKESLTLDAWMMGRIGIIKSFNEATKDIDIAVVEGVMGLYDGVNGKRDFASSAYVAKLLKANVILVIDAAKASRSIAAIALGYIKFDRDIKIVGIILNNVSGERHAKYITDALAGIVKVPILGIIARNKGLRFKERYLGLVPSEELSLIMKKEILRTAKRVSESIDFEKLVKLLKPKSTKKLSTKIEHSRIKPRIKIAVALDNSFNFYYSENLNVLRLLGADILFFSPLSDKEIPHDISGMMLGGGFPEILANRLCANGSMSKSIKLSAERGLPIYAECGGLMYLTNSIVNYGKFKGSFRMVGIIDANTSMTEKITLNYTKADMCNPMYGTISNLKGHEFHYSKIQNIAPDLRFAYHLKRGHGIDGKHDGVVIYNTLASYMHLHFYDNRFPRLWIQNCHNYERR
jgi:cobyrinic acid a,c-diamide synthase